MKIFGVDPTLGIEPELGGKVLAVALLTQGLLLSLFGKQQRAVYNWGETKEAVFLCENAAAALLSLSVVSCCMQFQDMTFYDGLVYFGGIWLANIVRWLWKGSYKAVGIGMDKVFLCAGTSVVTVYGGHNKPDWFDMALKFMISFYTLTALHGLFMPESSSKLWGINMTPDKKIKFEVRHFQMLFLLQEVQTYLLFKGMEPYKALGLTCLIATVFFWDGFFGTKAFIKVFEKPDPGYLLWLFLLTFLCFVILVPEEVLEKAEEAGTT